MMVHEPIPVTIITGFLGAGKTTLLNHLIKENSSTKFAIIENEFGEIPIDNQIIVNVSEENIFELSNGCICCSINQDLIEVLFQLLDGNYKFEHLIIETTGIAEPSAVAAAFLSEPRIQEYFTLNACICIADVKNLPQDLNEVEEARQQIAFADYILLNKTEEASSKETHLCTELIKTANPFAIIEHCNYAQTSTALLELNAYTPHNLQEKLSLINHSQHSKHPIKSLSFAFDVPFNFLSFNHWINALLQLQGQHMYRVKGILYFQGQSKPTLLQSVKSKAVFQTINTKSPNSPKISQIVLIGKNLRKEIFKKHLINCLYEE